MSKQFPEKSKIIYTSAGFGVDEVSKETLETNMSILKGIALEQENKIKLLKEELKREREGNDYTSKCGIDAHGVATFIINQRKIKSEDL